MLMMHLGENRRQPDVYAEVQNRFRMHLVTAFVSNDKNNYAKFVTFLRETNILDE